MYGIVDIFPLIFVVVLLWYWWSAQGIKERALRAAKAHCEGMEVQLLDDGVALHRLWFKRDGRGSVRVWRLFRFEFTATGEERYGGTAEMLGMAVVSLHLAPHRIP